MFCPGKTDLAAILAFEGELDLLVCCHFLYKHLFKMSNQVRDKRGCR